MIFNVIAKPERKLIMIKLQNTLSGHKEELKPIQQNKVELYVCGVTPYDYAHLGHGRCYTAFDLLVRLLKFLQYDVVYCRNFTDIDDKTHKQIESNEIVQEMLTFLKDDLNTPGMLGVLFENLDRLQKNHEELCEVKQFLQEVLGLSLLPLPEKKIEITPEIQEMLDAREKARHEKNWKLADELRDKLVALGVDLADKKI